MSKNRDKCDPALGELVHQHLLKVGVETPTTSLLNADAESKVVSIKSHMTEILSILGLDLTDDSLMDTPLRVAKMFVNELYWGMEPKYFPKCTTVSNKMGYDEMVLEKGITILSDCEHHLRTIVGKAAIAYIPKDKVLGLSKLNRVADYFSRRPQIQERLAEQIYHALVFILGTEDVAVVIDAEHFCVKQRGVQDSSSSTVTSKLGGCFKSDPTVRAEFMSLIK
jgi:GTP cyclohydrolase I